MGNGVRIGINIDNNEGSTSALSVFAAKTGYCTEGPTRFNFPLWRTYGVVSCGVVWCGVVWCGLMWCGVVWCGVV